MIIRFRNETAPAAGNGQGAKLEIVKPINNAVSGKLQPSPLAAEIKSCALALERLETGPRKERRELLAIVSNNLFALADYARELESSLVAPHE